MTINHYPKNSYWLVANGSTLNLGSFTNTTWGDLALAQIRVFSKNPASYSYQMRLVISATQTGTALSTSEYFTFDNAATGQVGNDWLGDVTFDMPPYALINTETYHLRLELTGYTRANAPNQNTQYLAVWCDWMQPIGNTNTGAARIPMGMLR